MSDTTPKRRRLRFSYSLAGLFLVLSVLGIGLGFAVPLQTVRQRQEWREWIRHHRGQVMYSSGEWERWGRRDHIERAQGDFVMSTMRSFLGDQKAVMICLHDDGSLSEAEIAQIKSVFPEADIWFVP